jgi:hypothetical protein
MIVQDYPKMLYRTVDTYLIVDNDEQEINARKDGFQDYADVLNPKPKATKAPKSNTQEAVDGNGNSNV